MSDRCEPAGKGCQNRVQDPGGSSNPSFVDTVTCSSCGHAIELYDQSSIRCLPGLPVGTKFDPSDQEILEHLEAKVMKDTGRMHPLIDEFIPTLEGRDGICSMHPEKLPACFLSWLEYAGRPASVYYDDKFIMAEL